jgi:flagellar biosynthetic protein FliR
MGGERAMIYLASGAKQGLIPGVFIIQEVTIDFLIRETGNVITMGVLLSAPVVVALLLVQLVMGIISKAVSTINVFVVSFPITVGAGLIILLFSIASIVRLTEKEFRRLETQIFEIILSQSRK